MNRRRWEQTSKEDRELVLDAMQNDVAHLLTSWPDDELMVRYANGLAAARRFLLRCEDRNIVRVGVLLDRTDTADVVWGAM